MTWAIRGVSFSVAEFREEVAQAPILGFQSKEIS